MQKITPFLWFDQNAEEAAKFYTSIFRNSRITEVTHYTEASSEASGQPKGAVMTVTFELEGQEFIALNGGPVFKFTPAISLSVSCKTQQEVDARARDAGPGEDDQDRLGRTEAGHRKTLDDAVDDERRPALRRSER